MFPTGFILFGVLLLFDLWITDFVYVWCMFLDTISSNMDKVISVNLFVFQDFSHQD